MPSKQNLLCGGVSALQVIQRPRPLQPRTPPSDTPYQHYTESPPPPVTGADTAPGAVPSFPATGSAGSHVVGLSAVPAAAAPLQPATIAPVSLGPPLPPGKRRKRKRREKGEEDAAAEVLETGGGGRSSPEFVYTLSSTTKYHVLLDQTAGMGRQDRWTNVKRALFRFIDLLPVGSRLNMIAFGDTTREVLPTTTVTELNRDGLFGRIPRRKPELFFINNDFRC